MRVHGPILTAILGKGALKGRETQIVGHRLGNGFRFEQILMKELRFTVSSSTYLWPASSSVSQMLVVWKNAGKTSFM